MPLGKYMTKCSGKRLMKQRKKPINLTKGRTIIYDSYCDISWPTIFVALFTNCTNRTRTYA